MVREGKRFSSFNGYSAFADMTAVRRSLHPKLKSSHTALQRPITRQRPEREVFAVAVITQVENARETGAGVELLIPQTVLSLRVDQISNAARDRRVPHLTRGHQRERCPGRLRRRAWRLLVTAIDELVAVAVLAPAAVFVWNGGEPVHRLADHRMRVWQASGVERAQHRPG